MLSLLRIFLKYSFKLAILLSMIALVFLLRDEVTPTWNQFIATASEYETHVDQIQDNLRAGQEKLNKLVTDEGEREAALTSLKTQLSDAEQKVNDILDEGRKKLALKHEALEAEIKRLEANKPWFYQLEARAKHKAKLLAAKTARESIQLADILTDEQKRERITLAKLQQEYQSEAGTLARLKKTILAKQEELQAFTADLDSAHGNVPFAERMKTRWNQFLPWLAPTILALVLAPITWASILYFIVSPMAMMNRPLGFSSTPTEPMSLTVSGSKFDVVVHPGESLYTRNGLVTRRMVTNRLRMKTRVWRLNRPGISFVAGLFPCTIATNDTEKPHSLTLSPSDPDLEIAELSLEEGSSIVLHPHNIVAIKGPITVHVKWRIFSLNAWLTCQIRYLIFSGPGSLYLSAPRGISEIEIGDATQAVEQHLVVGFDAGLQFSVRRTETFVPYLFGKVALFEDSFSGNGMVLLQNAGATSKKNSIEAVFTWVFTIVGKLLGF